PDSEPAAEGHTEDNSRCCRTAQNHLSEPAEDAVERLACRNSRAASKTCTEEDLHRQIARDWKRCFWSGGAHRFPGSRMGKQGCQRGYNRCLGWGREIHAG